MTRMLPLVLISALIISTAVQAEDAVPTVLANRGKLLVDDDGSIARGGKKKIPLNEKITVRAWAGKWEKRDSTGAVSSGNIWRSTWHKSMGHTPVAAYDGLKHKNLIVEVTFRYGTKTEDWHFRNFRIACDNIKLYAGHMLSAWANIDNDFIEHGFLLQHISKKKDKTILKDLLLDHQPIQAESKKWYTAVLEVAGDEALFRMGEHSKEFKANHVAWCQAKEIADEKIKVSLTLGATWHEIKRVRIWEASRHPQWKTNKDDILKARQPFQSQPHTYIKPWQKDGKNRKRP